MKISKDVFSDPLVRMMVVLGSLALILSIFGLDNEIYSAFLGDVQEQVKSDVEDGTETEKEESKFNPLCFSRFGYRPSQCF